MDQVYDAAANAAFTAAAVAAAAAGIIGDAFPKDWTAPTPSEQLGLAKLASDFQAVQSPFARWGWYDPNAGLTQTANWAVMIGSLGRGSGPTYLYQKISAAGGHLKFGITVNPARRYSASALNDGRLRLLSSGERPNMLSLERKLHQTLPIGPEERQAFYKELQRRKGLRSCNK